MSWSRGLRVQAALTGCVTVAAVIAGVIGGGSGATPFAAGKVIALMRNAPLALSAYPSLTMRMSVKVSANGRSVNLVVNGVASSDGHSGIATEQLPDGLGTVHLTVANHAFYGQVSPSHYAETEGKQWVELKLTTSSPTTVSPSSAAAYVQLLAGVGNVKDKGASTIDGTKVEHYHVDVDVAKAVAQVPPELQTTSAAQLHALGVTTMPMDVWLTDSGLPVQMKFSINLQGASVHVTLKLRGSNHHVTIVIPPANETYEVSNIAELGHLIAP